MTVRQQVLHLWLAAAALDTPVTAWAFYDGADGTADDLPDDRPPYRTGVAALVDGWFLLQAPGPLDPRNELAETGCEFVFVRTVDLDPDRLIP